MAKNSGNMLKGLTNDSPKASDASTKPPSGSVNDGATRSSAATTPKTLGPRST